MDMQVCAEPTGSRYLLVPAGGGGVLCHQVLLTRRKLSRGHPQRDPRLTMPDICEVRDHSVGWLRAFRERYLELERSRGA